MPRGPFFSHRPGGFGAEIFSGNVRETLQREMNRVFDEVWRNIPGAEEGQTASASASASSSSASSATTQAFSVDVTETATEVRVRADLPGVAEDDVDLTLDDDRLTIRAERRSEQQSGSERAHAAERSVGVLQRTLRLPAEVDPDQVEARFERGVLTVVLSKPKAAERGRKIPIRGAAPSTGGSTGASGSSSFMGGPAQETGPAGGASGSGFIQGDGALGPSPSTGAGDVPALDGENAAKPGGAIHGYNE